MRIGPVHRFGHFTQGLRSTDPHSLRCANLGIWRNVKSTNEGEDHGNGFF
jgi:hypothetical protein